MDGYEGGGGGQGHAQKPLPGLIVYTCSTAKPVLIFARGSWRFWQQHPVCICCEVWTLFSTSVGFWGNIATYKYIKCLHPLYIFSPLSTLVISINPSLLFLLLVPPLSAFPPPLHTASPHPLFPIFLLFKLIHIYLIFLLRLLFRPLFPTSVSAHCFSGVFISFTSSFCYFIPFLYNYYLTSFWSSLSFFLFFSLFFPANILFHQLERVAKNIFLLLFLVVFCLLFFSFSSMYTSLLLISGSLMDTPPPCPADIEPRSRIAVFNFPLGLF